jgi:hypothetical protein
MPNGEWVSIPNRVRDRLYGYGDEFKTFCGPQYPYKEADRYETLPSGFWICRKCAERFAYEAERTLQRQSPDAQAYLQKTLALLRDAGQAVSA